MTLVRSVLLEIGYFLDKDEVVGSSPASSSNCRNSSVG